MAAILAVAGGAAFAAPANVLIRAPAGTSMPAGLPSLFAQWRQSGQVANVLLLTQGRPEKSDAQARFEALAVLEFPNENSAARWEKESAPSLPAGLIVRRADALAHGELSPRDPNHSIFVVNTYTPKVSASEFNEFVQGYIKPLYEAMRATKHLVRYTAYLERGAIGEADAINVLEYRDAVAFAAMPPLKTKIRTKLAAEVPSYAKYDPIKDTLRVDGGGTLAAYTELPPPDLKEQRRKPD